MQIILQFPFEVAINPKQYTPGQSTVLLDSTYTSVSMMQIRKAGSVVPESVFCLKKLQALVIENMVFAGGNIHFHGLSISDS